MNLLNFCSLEGGLKTNKEKMEKQLSGGPARQLQHPGLWGCCVL
jgi:hypothetical protein